MKNFGHFEDKEESQRIVRTSKQLFGSKSFISSYVQSDDLNFYHNHTLGKLTRF